VKFGVWHPVAEASTAAPDWPGLLQARAEELVPYPRGKSAMVLYAACRPDETLRRYVRAATGAAALRRAAAHGARWVRFGQTAAPERELSRLTSQFQQRFGALPAGNAAEDSDPDQPHDHPEGARTPNG
jgi:hypothetical protein